MGNRARRLPRKEEGREVTHLLSKEQICFAGEKKRWLVDFILASPRHQRYWRMSTGEGRGLSCWTDKPTNYKQPLTAAKSLFLHPSTLCPTPLFPMAWRELTYSIRSTALHDTTAISCVSRLIVWNHGEVNPETYTLGTENFTRIISSYYVDNNSAVLNSSGQANSPLKSRENRLTPRLTAELPMRSASNTW